MFSFVVSFLFLVVYPCMPFPRKVSWEFSDVTAVHISFGNQTNELSILWGTSYPISDSPPRVRYGLTAETMNETATGKTIKFRAGKVTHLHRIVISNLQHGRKYYYQIIKFNTTTTTNLEASSIFTFKTYQSTPTNTNNPTSFLVFADLGTLSKSTPYLIQESLNHAYTSVMHIGDIAYDLASHQGQVGERFLSSLQDMVSRLPYLTVPGDHESFDGYESYRHWFSMPKQGWPMPAENLWYSLDIGLIHFIILVTEDFITGSPKRVENQLNWLNKDLKEANLNRYLVPWIVVLAHRPLYCSVQSWSEDCAREDSKVRQNLEDVIFTGGVDLVISGHEHNYERTLPVYKKRVLAYHYKNAPGPVHLIVGTCGYSYIVDRIKSNQEYWSAFSDSNRHQEMFGRLHVYNKSHIYWEMLRADTNQLVDKMWLIKDTHGPFTLSKLFPPKQRAPVSGQTNILRRYFPGYTHSRATVIYIYLFCLFSALTFICLLRKQLYNFYRLLTNQIMYTLIHYLAVIH